MYFRLVRLLRSLPSVNKLEGSGGMLPQEKIRHSEIASGSTSGPKRLLESPHL